MCTEYECLMRLSERCVCPGTVIRPPNQLGDIANIKVNLKNNGCIVEPLR